MPCGGGMEDAAAACQDTAGYGWACKARAYQGTGKMNEGMNEPPPPADQRGTLHYEW